MLQIVLRRHRRVIRVRMIVAHYVQLFCARVTLAAHQLFRRDQRTMVTRFLFTSVGDWIGFLDEFPVGVESTKQKPTAFMRVIALAVPADFVKVTWCKC